MLEKIILFIFRFFLITPVSIYSLFRLTEASAAIPALPFRHESVSTNFISLHYPLDFAITKLLSSTNQGTLCGPGTWHAWERRGIFAGFWWEKSKKRGHLEDLSVGERVILKCT
jgi:hypothetical protein